MRTDRTIVKTTLLGLVCLALFASSAQANRRISLADNLLIEDKDDVYQYPQRLLDYRNLINLDMGNNFRSARLLFLAGWDDLGLGLSAEQSAPYNPMSGPVVADLLTYETAALYMGPISPTPLAGSLPSFNPFGITSSAEYFVGAPPFTLIDAFLAIPAGDGAFGLRLGFGTRGAAGTDESLSSYRQDSGLGENLITLEAGLSGGPPTGAHFDTSLNIALGLGSGENGQALPNLVYPTLISYDFDEISSALIRASLSARAYLPYSDNIDLGLLGNIVLSNISITPSVAGENEFTMSTTGVGLMGGAGPVFHINELTEVAGYALLGLTVVSSDPDDEVDNDSYTDLAVYLPAVRVAADIGIVQWFFFRIGLQYSFQYVTTSFENDDSGRRADGNLGWTAGIGFEYEGFTIDGALNQAWMVQGPDFIGGDAPLFGVVAAGFTWQ